MSYNLSAIYGKDDNPAERLKPRIEHGKERPKLKKPFDISDHELFKKGIISKNKNGRDLHVNHLMWDLDKDRAIAIAKALGVTGEDLL